MFLYKFYLIFVFSFLAILYVKGNEDDGEDEDDWDEEEEERDFCEICEELAQFTPNLCDNARATEKCTNICSDAAAQELDCGMKGSNDAEQQIEDIRINLLSRKNRKESRKMRLTKIKQMKQRKEKTIKKVSASKRTTRIKKMKVSSVKTIKNLKGSKRIVGGERSDPGEWPWQVLLNYTEEEDSYCGGAILSKHFVLTASHCFLEGDDADNDPNHWRVVVGDHDRLASGESNETNHEIQKIITHEDYDYFDYDIAIIQLKEEIHITDENKGRICLPNNSYPVRNGDICYVTGWGITNTTLWDADSVLHEAPVLVLDRLACNIPAIYNGSLDDTMFCAGDLVNDRDSCEGDSGGSLVCPVEGRYYSQGIVSWGEDCAHEELYGVYANVTMLKDWVVTSIIDKSDPF